MEARSDDKDEVRAISSSDRTSHNCLSGNDLENINQLNTQMSSYKKLFPILLRGDYWVLVKDSYNNFESLRSGHNNSMNIERACKQIKEHLQK